MKRGFVTGLKEGLTVKTLTMVIVAILAYIVARVLHAYALARIRALRRVPEVSDIIVILLGAGFLRDDMAKAAVTGGGLSLIRNLFDRFNVKILKR